MRHPQPTPRIRRRTTLYEFDHGCSAGVLPRQGWIDRLKFSISGITLRLPCNRDDLRPYLEQRRSLHDNRFTVEGPSTGKVFIRFRRSTWHFDLKITLTYLEGRWVGAGSLELNPTRLLATAGDNYDGDFASRVNEIDLLPPYPPSPRLSLDGRKNFIPTRHLATAINCDWPTLCQSNVDAVLRVLSETIGSAQEFRHESGDFEPLVRMPPCGRWAMKEAEVYYEFRDADAPLQVAAISQVVRGLTGEFSEDAYGADQRSIVTRVARTANMPSVRIGLPSVRVGLGAEDIYLAVYAKATDRVRLEVRYKRYPITRGARLPAARFASSEAPVSDMLSGLIANATRRINRFLRAYRTHTVGSEASLVRMVLALVNVAAASQSSSGEVDSGTLRRVMTLLIAHGGMSRSENPAIQQVIDALVLSRVLQRVDLTLRPTASEFTVSPAYSDTFRLFRGA